MSGIIIAHTSHDEDVARALATRLSGQGYKGTRLVLIPSHVPERGEIASAGAYIAIWSPESVKSVDMDSAAQNASTAGKLISVRRRSTEKGTVPLVARNNVIPWDETAMIDAALKGVGVLPRPLNNSDAWIIALVVLMVAGLLWIVT